PDQPVDRADQVGLMLRCCGMASDPLPPALPESRWVEQRVCADRAQAIRHHVFSASLGAEGGQKADLTRGAAPTGTGVLATRLLWRRRRTVAATTRRNRARPGGWHHSCTRLRSGLPEGRRT